MLQPSTLKFLKDLKKNNNKPWMDAHRDAYLAAKEDHENFVTAVLEKFSKSDPDLVGLKAKDCTFRINRDVRFSKDKSPYKSNFGAYFSRGGKKSIYAGYYFHFDAEKSFAGGGMWHPMPPELKKIRQEIDYNFEDFSKILKSKRFANQFGGFRKGEENVLSRPPKGYDDSNPAIEFIKMKNFVATRPFANSILTSKDLVKQTVTAFEALMPLVKFINQAFE